VPVSLKVGLRTPRQALAMDARRFFQTEIVQAHSDIGTHEMPHQFQICLTNAQSEDDQKFLSFKYFVNFNASLDKIVVGQTPVNIYLNVRRGIHTRENKTLLPSPFNAFQRLLFHAREMLNFFKKLEGRNFPDAKSVSLPKDVILCKTGPKTVIMLIPSVYPDGKESGKVTAAVNIREFALKTGSDIYSATTRGVCIGMRALYMLAYPCAQIIKQWHDKYIDLIVTGSAIATVAQHSVEVLEKFENCWNRDDEIGSSTEHDALSMDEKFVIHLEKMIDPKDIARFARVEDSCDMFLSDEEENDEEMM